VLDVDRKRLQVGRTHIVVAYDLMVARRDTSCIVTETSQLSNIIIESNVNIKK